MLNNENAVWDGHGRYVVSRLHQAARIPRRPGPGGTGQREPGMTDGTERTDGRKGTGVDHAEAVGRVGADPGIGRAGRCRAGRGRADGWYIGR